MRKSLLLLMVWGISLNLFSQMQIPELTFVFDNQSAFTEQFLEKENSKVFTFQIEGITNALDEQALLHMVKQMRGVEEFVLEPSSVAGQYSAKLKVYKHASGWWYWKTFMQKTGVPHFKIGDSVYTADAISNIE